MAKKSKNKDIVNIVCYGVERTMPRKEAIDYFTEGLYSCDCNSSEHDRYECILKQLYSGYTFATDEY